CRQEIPHFIELQDEYEEEGLEILGVSMDVKADNILEPFSKREGINYTLLVGDSKVTALYGGIRSIPTTFLIDRKGMIRKKYIGYRDKEVFEKDIKELL
ncbi:MAG: TlpA disulfide reductase family protein, partial [Candidatus Omnitrophota bacterium]|nr:TlpA disulfide reductase family protein [Candidatus Omnitrophota bacterium]